MAVDSHNKRLGKQGENAAVLYLVFHGWRIVERNFVSPFGEIDIIARKGETLAFIEVKTRLTETYGVPSEAVNARRKQRYISGANFFLTDRNIDLTVRFDIIEVYRGKINHLENAFEA